MSELMEVRRPAAAEIFPKEKAYKIAVYRECGNLVCEMEVCF